MPFKFFFTVVSLNILLGGSGAHAIPFDDETSSFGVGSITLEVPKSSLENRLRERTPPPADERFSGDVREEWGKFPVPDISSAETRPALLVREDRSMSVASMLSTQKSGSFDGGDEVENDCLSDEEGAKKKEPTPLTKTDSTTTLCRAARAATGMSFESPKKLLAATSENRVPEGALDIYRAFGGN